MNLWFSFTNWQGVGSPEWTGLDNYRRLLEDETFWASFRHNAALIVAMAVVPDRARAAAGRGAVRLHRQEVRHRHGRSVLRACFYLPQVLPVAVAGIVWGWILQPDGALNASWRRSASARSPRTGSATPDLALYTRHGVMVWVQLGFPVVIFMAGLQRVDPELYEAAELDGASWWQRFRHITCRRSGPRSTSCCCGTTIAALKVFGPIYVLTRGGPGGATNVPSYFSYQNFFEKHPGRLRRRDLDRADRDHRGA